MSRVMIVVVFEGSGDHRDLHVLTHSFPTRRSSDLIGRRRIAFLGDASAHAPEFQDRYTGLCRAMAAAGLAADPALRQNAVSSEESGSAAAQALPARGTTFDATFQGSDLIAIRAMRALAEAKLRLPPDDALTAFATLPAPTPPSQPPPPAH